jgi:hypothetical protein
MANPLSDELEALELRLAKYPEDEPGSGPNRRLILHEVIQRLQREEFDRGWQAGFRNAHSAEFVERHIRDTRTPTP